MRSLILIGSYLWKDTWKRWFEQPSSPLARLFVTGLLVLVATVILVIFQLLERSLRDRLEKFGIRRKQFTVEFDGPMIALQERLHEQLKDRYPF